MYRCYLIHQGRIVQSHDLPVATLQEAIAQGRQLLAAQTRWSSEGGIEIWQRTSLLYSDKCHSDDTGRPAPVSSPFHSGESRVLPDSRPSITSFLPSPLGQALA